MSNPASAEFFRKTNADNQFCTFYVGDLFFGVNVLHVREILHPQPMTPVPRAPGAVAGLINLRGQIVTAIDLRRHLNLPSPPANQSPMNVVISTPDGALSLLVDEIGDILQLDGTNHKQPPGNLDLMAREMICGVYELNDRLLLILDEARTAGSVGRVRNSQQ